MGIAMTKNHTRGYYLPEEMTVWLEASAERERRSVSNFLALLIERARGDATK